MKIKFIFFLCLYLSVCYYYVEGTTTQDISRWVVKLSNREMYNPHKEALFNELGAEVEEFQSLSVFDDPNVEGNDPMKIQFLQSLTNVFQHVQEIRSIIEIYQKERDYPEFVEQMVHQTRMIRKMTESWKEADSIKRKLKELMLSDSKEYIMHILSKKDMYDHRKKKGYDNLKKLVQSFALLNLSDFYDPVTSQFLQSLTNVFLYVQKIRSYIESYNVSVVSATGVCDSYLNFIENMKQQVDLIRNTITMWEMDSSSIQWILQKLILSNADKCLDDYFSSEHLISTIREEISSFLYTFPSLSTYVIVADPLELLLNPLTSSPDDLKLMIELLFHLAPEIYRSIPLDPQNTPEQIQDWNDCIRQTILMSDRSASLITAFVNQIILILQNKPTLSTYEAMASPLQVLLNHQNVDGYDRQRILDSLLLIAPTIYHDILDHQYFLSHPHQVADWIEFTASNLLIRNLDLPVISMISRITLNLKFFLQPRKFVPSRTSLLRMLQDLNQPSRTGICWGKNQVWQMINEINERYRNFQKHMTKVYLILVNGIMFSDIQVVKSTVENIFTSAKQSMKKCTLLFYWREMEMKQVRTLIETVKYFHRFYHAQDCEKLRPYYRQLVDENVFIPYDRLFVQTDNQSSSIHLSKQEQSVLEKFSGKKGKNYVRALLKKKYENLCH